MRARIDLLRKRWIRRIIPRFFGERTAMHLEIEKTYLDSPLSRCDQLYRADSQDDFQAGSS